MRQGVELLRLDGAGPTGLPISSAGVERVERRVWVGVGREQGGTGKRGGR
mgnify:CR=1 FL=1